MRKITEPMRQRRKAVVLRFASGEVNEKPADKFLLPAHKIIPFVSRIVAIFPHRRNPGIAIAPQGTRYKPKRRYAQDAKPI